MGFVAGAIENSFHQPATEPAVLDGRLYSNWPHPGNCRSLVKKIAADNLAVELRHDTEEMRMRKQHGHEFSTDLDGGNIRREVVLGGDRGKRIENDPGAWLDVGRKSRTKFD